MLFLEESGLGGAGDGGASAAFLAQLLLHLVQVLQEASIPGLHACECCNATESRAQTFGCTCFTEFKQPPVHPHFQSPRRNSWRTTYCCPPRVIIETDAAAQVRRGVISVETEE